MTRIVIDLPEKDLLQLDNLAAIRHLSRAELIMQALIGDQLTGSFPMTCLWQKYRLRSLKIRRH
ncbi:hypothetical protein [Sodalis ligni]|jgi:hypothetical protein|uniref:Ribbon-helix-helix CopG family protein n=1 Tax=Sodalis ligni TaxID=2697027 RepID=A0A4R1NDY0_9GAMM|nr:hypothetical protein [Sodalis ligni]TCL05795.1 hypothetical protein EZJ58_4015 [Sodalis ligni]